MPGVRAEVRRVRREVVGEFARNDLLTYSSAIAFQVLYAVAPLAMLALAGLSLVGERSVYTEHIAPALHHHVSPQAFTIANRTAARVMGSERWWWTTLGVAITIWGVSASLRAMTTPLNAIYDARDNRSWARRIAVSIGAGVIVIVCVLTALGVVLGGRLVHPSGAAAAVAFFLLRWLVALALLLTTIAVVLRAVPAKKRPVRWVTLGSLLAAVCWIGATVGFGAYISAVSYATFYGGLGSVILLLVYLHVSAIAFLLGVTVDASLREEVTRTKGRRRRGRSRTPVGT